MKEVLVIGLDGGTWTLLQNWIDQGHLPELAALQREGASGVLRSTLPVVTSAAWSAFMTGTDPSNTGIYDFFCRDQASYSVRTMSRLQIRGIPLWKKLSRFGKTSVLINVPMTYPAEEDPNVLSITGIPTPNTQSPGFTNPPDLFERFHLNKDEYRITVSLPEYEGRYTELISDLKKMVRGPLKAAEVLIQQDWNLFIIHFFATDIVQHALWRLIDPRHPQYDKDQAAKYGGGLLEVFSEVDQAIAELLKRVDPERTSILIMSDHGFGPNQCTVHMNRWLQEVGMLRLRPPLIRLGHGICKILLKKAGFAPQGFVGKCAEGLASIPGSILPTPLQQSIYSASRHILSSSPVGSNLFRLRGYVNLFEGIDWKRTKAYSVGTSGLIHINRCGREPEGIVSPGKDYEEVRNAIAAGLISLTDGRGRRIFDRVYRKEEIYHGRFVDEAPDLIPLSETVGCYCYPFLDREGIIVEAEGFRSGNHRREGLLIAKGPPFRKDQKVDEARIIDLAPTISYLLDVPLSRNMDGTLIEQIFEPEYLQAHPLGWEEAEEAGREAKSISLSDEGQMAKKLEDLGYL